VKEDDELSRLYRVEFPRLVRSLAVAFSVELAADAVQDAFLVADRKWSAIRQYDDPVAWIRRVALNKARNQQRNLHRRAEILDSIRPQQPPPGDESLLDLRDALAQLPTGMRVTVCLYYVADLPVKDIADTLGVSAGTVKSNLHDARERLRSLLSEGTATHHEK